MREDAQHPPNVHSLNECVNEPRKQGQCDAVPGVLGACSLVRGGGRRGRQPFAEGPSQATWPAQAPPFPQETLGLTDGAWNTEDKGASSKEQTEKLTTVGRQI